MTPRIASGWRVERKIPANDNFPQYPFGYPPIPYELGN